MDDAEILSKVGKFAAPLVTDPNVTPEDVIRIGAAFVAVAEEIYRAVGGNNLAAQQFYVVADRCAGKA
jgi:hypothetical protein